MRRAGSAPPFWRVAGAPLARRGACALLLGLALGACDRGGPGVLTASVSVPQATGAAVLEVRGEGVTGFGGEGETRVFTDGVEPRAESHRLVVVSADGQGFRFRIEVEDLSAPRPVATVTSAVGVDNRPIPSVQGYSVRVSR